jgi:hypothetical protein
MTERSDKSIGEQQGWKCLRVFGDDLERGRAASVSRQPQEALPWEKRPYALLQRIPKNHL